MPRPISLRSLGGALTGTLALLAASCGGDGPTLYPVSGKVLYDGEPAGGATVVFVPVGATDETSLKPSGSVQPDGSFTLSTHPYGEGAPAGDYVVLVTWYPEGARQRVAEEDGPKPPPKLPAQYSDAEQSPLKATVRDGPTELEPFQLSK
jgi:hypothetical protein